MKNGKGFLGEFKEFISRGSVVDLAVGVVIGGAFTAIITSLVNDIIMPVIGMLFGGLDFSELKYIITQATEEMPESAIYYGNFIQNIINFILIALVIFIMIKTINRFHEKKEEPDGKTEMVEPEDIQLLREIRDFMKKK